jgi:DNA-binding winged helix-turn-helix (wHTH) protein
MIRCWREIRRPYCTLLSEDGVIFRFDAFVLDEGSRQLLRGGREVHLSPKAFDLLARLIKARPRALSKSELHDQLWPGTFVGDASLAMLVTEIRGALDDNARRPRFVRTVHRFGYAFHGSVTEIAVPPSAAAGPGVAYCLIAPSRQITLAPGENVVGRDPGTAVRLDSPGVSRRHACILLEGDRVTLEDLGSKNGTHVRGDLVTSPTVLEDGDEIRFGSISVTFRVWTTSGSTESEP